MPLTQQTSRLQAAGPTIGVFDSGFGGLTVLRALLPLTSGARYLYLGDTARLPYGAKSRETVVRYALSAAAFLRAEGAEMLVVACNTASALALDELKQGLIIPVIGVIEPGTQAALSRTTAARAPSLASHPKIGGSGSSRTVLVLATTATVQSAAYTRSLHALGLHSYEQACPLLVPLVEEGWINHPVTAEVVRIYLTEALHAAPDASVLILGCTHYPLLKPLIEQTLHDLDHPLHIVDSASATALAATTLLPPHISDAAPECTFYATDSIEKFQRLGSAFLGQPLPEVNLIDLGG